MGQIFANTCSCFLKFCRNNFANTCCLLFFHCLCLFVNHFVEIILQTRAVCCFFVVYVYLLIIFILQTLLNSKFSKFKTQRNIHVSTIWYMYYSRWPLIPPSCMWEEERLHFESGCVCEKSVWAPDVNQCTGDETFPPFVPSCALVYLETRQRHFWVGWLRLGFGARELMVW